MAEAIHRLDENATEILPRRTGDDPIRPVPPGPLSLAFLTDSALARLHATFLGDPAPTDVMTFSGSAAGGPVGEICVSADAARAFARRHHRDFSSELTLYIVHGWLHLAGLDDRHSAARRRMRAAEARALARLRAAGSIPRFAFTR